MESVDYSILSAEGGKEEVVSGIWQAGSEKAKVKNGN